MEHFSESLQAECASKGVIVQVRRLVGIQESHEVAFSHEATDLSMYCIYAPPIPVALL